ncbi:MAG: hypothetical protein IID08_07205 [Candidatus Hydrogenedentes bacterium]|nr:hypothetical protein [Candidatus Hydrogenedentota bacterium]
MHKLLPLAFLAPDIVDEILDGRQPAMLTLEDLTKTKLPLNWEQQRTIYGFTESVRT